jgi:hypothetical protein
MGEKIILRRSDGYALCDDLNGGKCTCRAQGCNPCRMIYLMLVAGGGDRETATTMERERMNRGRWRYD